MIDVVNGRGKVDRVFHFREAFMFMSHAVWLDVMDGKLKGNTLRVLAFIASKVDMRNRFTGTQVFIADELGMTRQAVNKAFGELVQLGYVFRARERNGMRVVLLDAMRMYRGSGVRHSATVERQAKLRKGLEVVEDDLDPDDEPGPRGISADDAALYAENFRRGAAEIVAERRDEYPLPPAKVQAYADTNGVPV